MSNITLSESQYEALVALSIEANESAGRALRTEIDAANSITRYVLSVRWKDVGGKTPPNIELGKGWPPAQTRLIEMKRPIARADVDEVLRQSAVNPAAVAVTPDPYGRVGWTYIDDYNFENPG